VRQVGYLQESFIELLRISWKFKLINQPDAAINYRFIACRLNTAQHVPGILMPIIRGLSTAVAASGFTFGAW